MTTSNMTLGSGSYVNVADGGANVTLQSNRYDIHYAINDTGVTPLDDLAGIRLVGGQSVALGLDAGKSLFVKGDAEDQLTLIIT